jgi:hypothetical protein
MRRASLVIAVAAGILFVAALTLWILLFGPAASDVRASADRARVVTSELRRVEASAVGEDFERNVMAFALRRAEKAADVHVSRARVAARIDQPFADMKIEPGAAGPAFEDFQRAYHWNGDQLKVRIRDLATRAGGAEVKGIALIEPPFSAGPMDAATMKRWQRIANIEARLLETAAKGGAAPLAPARIEEERAPVDDVDPGYFRLRVALDLQTPDGRLSGLVHLLLACFDEFGGMAKLAGLSEAPFPEPRLKDLLHAPQKRVHVTLVLGFPVPVEDAP